jgi:hypothetical protein
VKNLDRNQMKQKEDVIPMNFKNNIIHNLEDEDSIHREDKPHRSHRLNTELTKDNDFRNEFTDL